MKRTKVAKKPVTAKEKEILGNFAFITWEDACTKQGWWGGEKPLTLNAIVSSGWVVADEGDRYTMVGDLDRATGNVCRTISIPKGCISEIKIVNDNACSKDFYVVSDKLQQLVKTAEK